MTVDERVAELLAGVPIEEQLRGREVSEGAKFHGLSVPTLYRKFSDGSHGFVKLEGGRRRGHGCAGAVRVRLIDLVTFQVENERVTGAGPIKKTQARIKAPVEAPRPADDDAPREAVAAGGAP